MIFLRNLSIGDYVEVYEVYKDKKTVITKRSRIGKNGFVSPLFLIEANILKNLSNPPEHLVNHPGRKNIIALMDIYELDGYLYMDLELGHGTLLDLNQKINLYNAKENILVDVSQGLDYIHRMGYNHTDLSFSNIIYVEECNKLVFKIIDFGNAVHMNSMHHQAVPVWYIMAPETVDFFRYGKNNFEHTKQDIWALGYLSYFLHTGRGLTDGMSLEEQERELNENLEEKKNDFSLEFSSIFVTKTLEMLNSNPFDRPTTYFCKKWIPDNYPNVFPTEINYPCHEFSSKSISKEEINVYKSYLSFLNILLETNNFTDKELDMIYKNTYHLESKLKKRIIPLVIKNMNAKCLSLATCFFLARMILFWISLHIFTKNNISINDLVGQISLRKINYCILSCDKKRITEKNLFDLIKDMCIELDWKLSPLTDMQDEDVFASSPV